MGITKAKLPAACFVLYGLLGFLSLGALFGGGMLMFSSSGDAIGMPTSILNGAFGGSFRLPGILLFIVLGVYPLAVLYGLLTRRASKAADGVNVYRDRHWSYAHALYVGFALLIWICTQVYILQAMAVLHIVYLALGFAILIVAMLPSVQEVYRK